MRLKETSSMVGLTRRPGASLHHQLFAILHSGISSGRYGGGSLLPSEDVLAETYNVSRATVRRAMQTLEAKGLIERRAGIGTRVFALPGEEHGASAVVDLVGALAGAGELVLMSFGFETASADICAQLDLPAGASVLNITRLRSMNDVPMRLTQHYLPEHLGKQLTPSILDGRLVAEVLLDIGVVGNHSENIISAILADATDADILKVEVGSPLLKLTRLLRTGSGQAVLLQHATTSPHREKLRIMFDADGKGIG